MHTDVRLKWGIAGYLVCLAAVVVLVSPFLPDMLAGIILPQDKWHPLPVNETVPMPLTVFFVLGPALALLLRWWKARRLPGSGIWLGIRAVVVALVIVLYAGALQTVGKARSAWDAHTRQVLTQLHAGISRNSVEKLLEANLAFIRLHPVSTSGRAGAQTFSRRYNGGFGSDDSTLCTLRIEYDPAGKMKTARYSKTRYLDGRSASCRVLAEVPSSGKTLPYECPAEAQL